MAVKLFISYAHKDENFKNALEEHLSPLKRHKSNEPFSVKLNKSWVGL